MKENKGLEFAENKMIDLYNEAIELLSDFEENDAFIAKIIENKIIKFKGSNTSESGSIISLKKEKKTP